MVYHKKQISSALTLHCVQTDKFKAENLSVGLVVPLNEQSSTVMPLVLSILTRGTEKYPSQGVLNRKLETLYGTTISLKRKRRGNRNVYGFSAWMLGDKYTDGSVNVFSETLDVICQMLYHPLRDENGYFKEHYVESEKTAQCDAIESIINNPRAFASKRCNEIMFEGDPYGIPFWGSVERVRAIQNEELEEAYRGLIYESQYEVFYVGAKDICEVETEVRTKLLPYLTNVKPCEIPTDVAWRGAGDVKRINESMPLAQSRLVLGFRTGTLLCDENAYSMIVLNEIYGFSPISKLFMNVRERLGLCYQCGSSNDLQKGVLFATSGIDASRREQAEHEILLQLAAIQNGEITDEEFLAAKKSLKNGYMSVEDSPTAIENFYMIRNDFGFSISPEEYLENIDKVTPESVIRLAKNVELDTVYFLEGTSGSCEEEEYDEND